MIGIRREDKHRWEARVPLTPAAVRQLVKDGIPVVVQPSQIRAYGDDDYRDAGAEVREDLSGAEVVFAVKEIPEALFQAGGAYVFFSHTIKGQPYNMPMLRRLMELGCTLIDYERIVDDRGRRLVFFGKHAGLAGMIDTLAVLGRRLDHLGSGSPFSRLRMAYEYEGLEEAKAAVASLRAEVVPPALRPFVVGFAGYGNVSKGAQEIFDLLDPITITPEELAGPLDGGRPYKVVFEERHLVAPNEGTFSLQEYYDHPERYHSVFEAHLARLSVLVNAIYWTEQYPRLVTKAFLQREDHRLLLIGDISCDIEGAVECTLKATTPGAPAYVYDPSTGAATDGVEGEGVAMMTTDCLPCELPRASSEAFTEALLPFVPDIARCDLSGALEKSGLPEPIRRACILWRGELTTEYRYLESFCR